MASNIVKNFAAVTVAGALLSFTVASAAVSYAVVAKVVFGHQVGHTSASSWQK
jgi:hypothetical protein